MASTNKLEDKYDDIIGNLAGLSKNKKLIMQRNKINDLINRPRSNFMVYFDISLFVAPPVIVKLEERLAKQIESDSKASSSNDIKS